MNYQKDSVTGRLAPTTVQTPNTIGGTAEAPSITYGPGYSFAKEQTGRGFYGLVPEGLLSKMKSFQQPSSIPVHMKGGPVDKALFASTLVLCGVGLAGCFKFFYDMSFPKKAEE